MISPVTVAGVLVVALCQRLRLLLIDCMVRYERAIMRKVDSQMAVRDCRWRISSADHDAGHCDRQPLGRIGRSVVLDLDTLECAIEIRLNKVCRRTHWRYRCLKVQCKSIARRHKRIAWSPIRCYLYRTLAVKHCTHKCDSVHLRSQAPNHTWLITSSPLLSTTRTRASGTITITMRLLVHETGLYRTTTECFVWSASAFHDGVME
jgi:hypothetical protein